MSRAREYFLLGDGEGEEERSYRVETLSQGRYRVETPEGKTVEVDAYVPASGELQLLIEGRGLDATVRREGTDVEVQLRGERHRLRVLNERERRMRAAGGGRSEADHPELVSPMAGKVVHIIAQVGMEVESGESLVVVEAMKMENDLKAHRSGVVSSIEVSEGQAVEIGDVLVVIDSPEA